MITKDDVRKLLKESNMSREEFALQIGAKKSTMDGWLGKKSTKEIPTTTKKLIHDKFFVKNSRFKIELSFADFERLRLKIVHSGKNPGEFFTDAIKAWLAVPDKTAKSGEDQVAHISEKPKEKQPAKPKESTPAPTGTDG